MKTLTKNLPHELTQAHVIQQLTDIISEMEAMAPRHELLIDAVHPNFTLSAQNLLHYLLFRGQEIRKTQDFLLHNGLSSLAHSEGHTKAQLERVLGWLTQTTPNITSCDFKAASLLKSYHAEQLLGAQAGEERPHIMVTLDAKNMQDTRLMEEMLTEGMTVARINCAHDTSEIWLQMITLLRKSMAKTGRTCKIYMDLAGPKIRINTILAKKDKGNKKLRLEVGDRLILAGTSEDASDYQHAHKKWINALVVEPAEIVQMIKPGEQLFFDDGKFAADVVSQENNVALIKISRINAKKPFLKPQKGINLPSSTIAIDALTKQDKANIPFICKHADLVGFSFVNQPTDIDHLRSEMNLCSAEKRPSIVLKIERLLAVQNLPALLLSGMKDEAFGVMIARGDLAVEIGFERLSEIQQEILWICEAAHTPVIWATQVLESLNKEGFATRSEITDAATAVMAECVMLNKGEYIIKTIKMLNNIITRQLGHISKKRYVMRPLSIAKNFTDTL